jgi:hypothetical protein
MTGKCCGRPGTTSNRRSKLRAEARREVMDLLRAVGRHKKARKIAEKFEKTNTLSKRDVKILRDLAQHRHTVAA